MDDVQWSDVAPDDGVEAQHEGWCRACSEPIMEGDPIVYSAFEDGWVHEDCA